MSLCCKLPPNEISFKSVQTFQRDLVTIIEMYRFEIIVGYSDFHFENFENRFEDYVEKYVSMFGISGLLLFPTFAL